MDGLEIRKLTKVGLADVRDLIEIVYNRKYSLNYIEKKYSTLKYCGVEYIATLGYLNNEIIAFYGALPILFKQDGKKVLAVQTCDSFTRKEYQGQGVYYKLAKASYEIMKQAGAEFTFAFHSENTFHSCKKLGWEILEHKQRFQIETGIKLPVFKLWSKYPIFAKVKHKKVNKAIQQFEKHLEFKNDYIERGFLSADYSREFIEYKNYLNNRIIEIAGCKIWLKFDFIMLVGAFSDLNENNIEEVLKGLNKIAKKLKINEILIQLNKKSKEYKMISKFYTSKESFLIGYYLFNPNIDVNNIRINYVDFDTFL
jgi:hypothetical protein